MEVNDFMYESDSEMDAKPTTIPMYPRRPSPDDPRWQDVAVRRRTRNDTNILRFPTEADDLDIMTIYAGDTIAIIPEIQYQYYVVARVGYHIGWVNFKHVKLLSLKPSPNGNILQDTKPDVPKDRDKRIAQHQEMKQRLLQQEQQKLEQERLYRAEQRRIQHEEQERLYREAQERIYQQEAQADEENYYEQETQPARVERQKPQIPKSDVNRIINKLKSLGGLFSRR